MFFSSIQIIACPLPRIFLFNFINVVFSDFAPIFLLTKRGNLSIQVGSYRFNRVSSKGPKYRWRCSKNPFGCRATLYTLENKIIRFERGHNH